MATEKTNKVATKTAHGAFSELAPANGYANDDACTTKMKAYWNRVPKMYKRNEQANAAFAVGWRMGWQARGKSHTDGGERSQEAEKR